MSIDRGRLYRIESGIANPYPDEIHLMADLYNAPELENFYCTGICPLGGEIPKAELAELDRISLRALSTFRKIKETGELLLDITEDGVISEDEEGDLHKVIKNLEELERVIQKSENMGEEKFVKEEGTWMIW